MAVLFKELDNEQNEFKEIGVFYNGEFTGKVTTEIQLRQMNLDQINDPESFLVETYDSHLIQAVKVPDDEVSIEEYRGDYIEADIDPEEYI